MATGTVPRDGCKPNWKNRHPKCLMQNRLCMPIGVDRWRSNVCFVIWLCMWWVWWLVDALGHAVLHITLPHHAQYTPSPQIHARGRWQWNRCKDVRCDAVTAWLNSHTHISSSSNVVICTMCYSACWRSWITKLSITQGERKDSRPRRQCFDADLCSFSCFRLFCQFLFLIFFFATFSLNRTVNGDGLSAYRHIFVTNPNPFSRSDEASNLN